MRRLIFFVLACGLCSGAAYAQQCLWAKSATGILQYSANNVTATDAWGNVFVAGNFGTDSIVFGGTKLANSGPGYSDIYIVKYNAAGKLLWAKSAGGSADDGVAAICTDATGSVYVAGGFSSATIAFGTDTINNGGSSNGYLVKYDSAGTVLWAKGIGSSGHDDATAVTTDTGGNVYVAGTFTSPSIVFGSYRLADSNGSASVYLAKYNAAGSAVWGIAQHDGNKACTMFGIKADNMGNVYGCGAYGGDSITFGTATIAAMSHSFGGLFVAKYAASSGSLIWAQGASGDNYNGVSAVTVDRHGNVYLTGNFSGSFIAFGSTVLINTAPGSPDIFVASYDARGFTRWANSAGGNDADYGTSIAADSAGNVYIAGSFASAVCTFDTSVIHNTYPGTGDVFMAKYDSAGNYQWAAGAGNAGQDVASGIAADNRGNVYMTGIYGGPSITFDGITISYDLGYTFSGIFVAKYSTRYLALGVPQQALRPIVTLVPNPAHSVIAITAADLITDVAIINSLGQTVYATKYNASKVQVNVADLTAGVYYVNINGAAVSKFIKE